MIWPVCPLRVRSHIPLHHRVREQRTRTDHSISVDSEASAVVAVDVRGVWELALQQRNVSPLVQFIISWRQSVPTPWKPVEG